MGEFIQHSAQNIQPIRVLIVDDSAFMRFTIGKRLSETVGIRIVGTAHDGEEALKLIPALNPDVVTMDIEMPRMDGLTTLREIMSRYPRPVIMLSSLTVEGARETVQALTWGAVDFIAKPSTKANIDTIIVELVAKIQKAAGTRVFAVPHTMPIPLPPVGFRGTRPLSGCDKVVVIGASTGGPRALNTLIPSISAELNATFLIVQHMPAGFTRSLAERLDSLSNLEIQEAAPGDALLKGRGLVAPGGFHMTLDSNGEIALNQNPPVHGVRPAVDVTMLSVARQFGKSVIGVILTGMGSDGTNGAMLVHSLGGRVIAEAESTCVVWGMPRSVAEAGAADSVVPLQDIPGEIVQAIRN
jgi:two-component system, chemotaxis family, protein-glutamate methylesterase/glutaminase